MKNSHSIDMTMGALIPKILLFSLPLMLSGVLQLLFNAADVIVVGRFAGSQSLAAVGSTSVVINLLVNLFVGLSVGGNVAVARHIGAGNEKAASDTVHTSIFISITGGLILVLVGLFFSKPILVLMSSPPDVINLATLYLRIYFLSMPALMVYNFGSALLRAQGDTRRPLIYLSIAGVINVIINLISVIVFKMGVAGVAMATCISQYVSAFLVFKCLMREDGVLHLDVRKIKINKRALKEVLRVGLPAGLQGIVFSLSNMVIQSTINSFGSTVMAGSAAAANIEGFVYVSMNAFHQAAVTFCSQNYGANKLDRVDKSLAYSEFLVVLVGVLLGGVAFLFGRSLLSIYSTDAAVIDAGMRRMSCVCLAYALCGMMDVFVGGLRGIGYSVMPMIVSLLGACGLRLLWIGTVFLLNPTDTMLYLSYPVSWAITALVHFICYMVVRKKVRKRMGAYN
ncbi:MAG: MATE family efflux transporter [Clostridia bacterium]|nr:MATE family efflux transporter [Clostridia bacterium]